MRRSFGVLFSLTIVAVMSASAEGAIILESRLSGSGQSSDASGVATGILNTSESAFTFTISLDGLDLDDTGDPNDVTGLHFYKGPPDGGESIVFGVISPSDDTDNDTDIEAANGTVTGQWDADEGNGTTLNEQLSALKTGGIYLNVQTNEAPDSAVSGAVVPEPATLTLLALGTGAIATARRRRS
jgi:hypothetical protein